MNIKIIFFSSGLYSKVILRRQDLPGIIIGGPNFNIQYTDETQFFLYLLSVQFVKIIESRKKRQNFNYKNVQGMVVNKRGSQI